MQKENDILRPRSAGFIVSAVSAVFSILAAVVYAVGYHNTVYMSWTVFALALVGPCVFALLSVFKVTERFAPLAAGILNFATFLLFIRVTYLYLSEVFFAGISLDAISKMNPIYPVCLFSLLVSFVLSNVSVYLRQSKNDMEKNG